MQRHSGAASSIDRGPPPLKPGTGGEESAGIIRRYAPYLPVSGKTPVVTLGEGGTPLILSERLSERTGAEVWLKCESLNPTGSFKDRGMTVAVGKALEEGARAIMCASTGNTSASAAAYAAKAGITCAVLIPAGRVAAGKLVQTGIHGARVVAIEGSFDDAFELTKQIAAEHPVTLVNSVNPNRLEGQKTAAFEVVEVLGDGPDLHLMPVGNAGNITAYWRGYEQAKDEGWAARLPEMYGFQAEGADPIVRGEVVTEPATVAGAIRIGNPAAWEGALKAARGSGGAIAAVSDAEILSAYTLLAAEGVFAEPASAAGVAGLLQMSGRGEVTPGVRAVCVITGHGLKDPDIALKSAGAPVRLPPDPAEIARHLQLA